MELLTAMLAKSDITYTYDNFAEGEAPEPPFLCYLLPGSDHFAADGRAYFKVHEVRMNCTRILKIWRRSKR